MNSTNESMSLLELFRMGGPVMWPLLAFSIATVSIAVERIIFIFFRSNLHVEDLKDEVLRVLEEGDYDGARKFLKKRRKKRMGARVLWTLFEFQGISEHRMEKNAETEAAACINKLESGFDFLVALGSISPLTGFLGTVTGMIGAFKSIAEATEVNAQIVANGIYEALITTVFGLVIAILAMTASSLLSHAVDRFAGDIEMSCSEIIAELSVNEAYTVKNET